MIERTDWYTLENLEKLRAELARKEPGNRSGGNPDKGVAHMKRLRSQIDTIEHVLKREGAIPYTPAELMKQQLDRQTPDRRKGCCTQLDGQWYRIRFTGRDAGNYWIWIWMPIDEAGTREPGSYIHPGPPPTP